MKYKYPCPECNGNGKIFIPFADCVRGMKVEKCERCNGFGWFEAKMIDGIIQNLDLVDEEGELI